MRLIKLLAIGIAIWPFSALAAPEQESKCHGTPASGSLEHGWQLPKSGPNFEAYSSLGVMAGRTYVHSKVYRVVTESYRALEKQAPGKLYVYGETGFEEGGQFSPHKTHQNGLSVDFFVPVLNEKGESVSLPISAFNKLGYNIEFDKSAKYESYVIDFEALAKHLLAVKAASDKEGVGIKVVILDNDFQALLMKSPSGKNLRGVVRFSVKKPWVRHDEHYHIEFIVPCA